MAAEDVLRIADATDSNRFKAQGNALGTLLARFTADRDALITAVRECEAHLAAITARLDASSSATPQALDELRQLIEQLDLAQRRVEAAARAHSEQALAGAEDAARRVEELATTQRRRADEVAELLARATANQDAFKTGLDVCQLQLAAITARLDKVPSGDPEQLTELRRLIERSEMAQQQADAHLRTMSEQAMARAEDAVRGIEELKAGQRVADEHEKALDALRAATERLTAVFEGVDARLEQLSTAAGSSDEATSQLAARVDGVEATVAALQLAAESRPVQTAAPERRWLRPALVTLVLASLMLAVLRWQDTLSRRPTVEHSPQLSSQTAELAPQAQPTPVIQARTQLQTETAQVDAEIAASTAPEAIPASSIVALEPLGTAGCVVEPQLNRVCLYQRTAEGIAAHDCYTFVVARVREWPRWTVGGEPTAQRIQLLDETGNASLQVVTEGAWADGDVVQLRQPDFDALVSDVVPWRTVWVASQEQLAPTQAADVAAVRDAFERWRQAWEGRRFDEYAGYYGVSFVPQSEQDLAGWRRYKQRLFERSGAIAVQVAAPSIFVIDKGATALLTFEQTYRSRSFTSRARKAMRWQREGERWTIGVETVLQEVVEPAGGKRTVHR